jgi:hypothetical protein
VVHFGGTGLTGAPAAVIWSGSDSTAHRQFLLHDYVTVWHKACSCCCCYVRFVDRCSITALVFTAGTQKHTLFMILLL